MRFVRRLLMVLFGSFAVFMVMAAIWTPDDMKIFGGGAWWQYLLSAWVFFFLSAIASPRIEETEDES